MGEPEPHWGWGVADAVGSFAGDAVGFLGGAAGIEASNWGKGGDIFGRVTGATNNVGGSGAMPFIGGALDVFTGFSKYQDGNKGGGVGDIINGVTGALGGFDAISNLGGAMPGVAGEMGQSWGGGVLTGIGGAAQMLGNMSEMNNHASERRGDYWGNDYWGAAGDATLGALHAGVGSWCPVADAYITGFELLGDGVGGAAGLLGEGVQMVDGWFGDDEVENRDWKFGAGDVLGWGLHGAHDLVDAIPGGHYVTDGIAAGVEGIGGAVGGAASAIADW